MFFTDKTKFAVMIMPLVFLLGFNLFGQQSSDNPYLLHQVLTRTDIRRMHLADLTGDGAHEYLIEVPQAGAQNALRVYESDLHRIYFQKNFQSQLLTFAAYPADSTTGILVCEKDQQAINLLLLDFQSGEDTLAFLPIYDLKHLSVDIDAIPPVYYDLNGDGFPEIFLAIRSGLGAEIRALFAVDIKNQSILWKFKTAPNIREVQIFCPDEANEPLLLISTLAPGNRYAINGMVDSKSYAIILNARDGNLLMLRAQGGNPSYTILRSFNQAGGPGLYSVTICQRSGAEGLGNLLIWNPGDFSVLRELPNLLPDELIYCADIDGDGRDEFIRSGHDNRIDIYNSQLTLISNFTLPGLRNKVELAMDFNGDGILELLVLGDGSTLRVIDDRGRVLAARDAAQAQFFPVRKGPDQNPHLGVFNMNSRVYYEYGLIPDAAVASKQWGAQRQGFIAGVLLTLILLSLIGLLFRRKLMLRSGFHVFKGLKVAVLIADLQGKIQYLNPAMAALTGMDDDHPQLLHVDAVFKKLGLSYSLQKWLEDDLKQPAEFETIPEITGQSKIHQIRIRPLSDKKRLIGVLVVAEDISASVNFKRSLAWTAMAQRLVHEIKNPLTTVKLTLQRLKMAYEQEDESKRRLYDSYIDSVLEEVVRLRNVADNFLKFFRAEHPEFKNVNFSELTQSLLSRVKTALPSGIDIRYEADTDDCVIDGDPTQLEMMLNNLIDNSIHAIRDKGYIEIRLHRQERIEENGSREYLIIEVEDNGCGIDEKKIEHIFEPYITDSTDGSGLGLPIVKKIVHAHGGSIRFNSKKDIGTFVTITLPVKQNGILK